MRERWLNYVLILTNRIYNKKRSIIGQEGIKALSEIILLFLYEILLAIVSLPLYLGLKSDKVTAYLEEKGGYEKIAYDYSLRRIITLTSASIIFLIWFIKLSVIIFTPNIYGPLKLYNVSNLAPVDILEKNLIAAETQIQTAEVLKEMIKPELIKAEKAKGGNYIFYGTGQPLAMVVLFLSDKQTAVYTDDIDEAGEWKIEYSRKDFSLSEGNHAVVAFSYDEKNKKRSEVSNPQYFKVTTSLLDKIIKNVDIYINITVVLIVALGLFLIILMI